MLNTSMRYVCTTKYFVNYKLKSTINEELNKPLLFTENLLQEHMVLWQRSSLCNKNDKLVINLKHFDIHTDSNSYNTVTLKEGLDLHMLEAEDMLLKENGIHTEDLIIFQNLFKTEVLQCKGQCSNIHLKAVATLGYPLFSITNDHSDNFAELHYVTTTLNKSPFKPNNKILLELCDHYIEWRTNMFSVNNPTFNIYTSRMYYSRMTMEALTICWIEHIKNTDSNSKALTLVKDYADHTMKRIYFLNNRRVTEIKDKAKKDAIYTDGPTITEPNTNDPFYTKIDRYESFRLLKTTTSSNNNPTYITDSNLTKDITTSQSNINGTLNHTNNINTDNTITIHKYYNKSTNY